MKKYASYEAVEHNLKIIFDESQEKYCDSEAYRDFCKAFFNFLQSKREERKQALQVCQYFKENFLSYCERMKDFERKKQAEQSKKERELFESFEKTKQKAQKKEWYGTYD